MAERTLRDYRDQHRTVPVPAPFEDLLGGFVCEWDGLHVYQVKGGAWRHASDEVRVLIEKAPIPSEVR